MRFLVYACAAVLLMAVPLRAQDTAPPPAYVAFVEGDVTIDHDGESEPAEINVPVLEGDHVRTQNGRAEIAFSDGSSVAIDPYSDVELLSGTRVRVLAGTIEHRPAPAVDPRSASTQYLPQDLQTYGQTFDQYGSWQYEAPYGYVWYPTVAADWRPYYYGYWSPVRRYGLTWIGIDRWSWPTHHYGRWGYARSRWYWIPGRTWATAWVSWGTAPDYVSWCPLGYDGRPVLSLSIGYRSAWNAWTVVPRSRFAVGRYAAYRYAVEPYRLASNTPFVVHRTPPSTRPGRVVAVGPARGDDRNGGVAVPRYGEERGQGASRAPDRGRSDDRDLSRDGAWATMGRRAPNADQQGTRGDDRSVGVAVPRYGDQRGQGASPTPSADRQASPSSAGPQSTTPDHPAYRPNYTPNYDPSPRYRQPQASGDANGRAVDRGPAYQRPDRSGNDAPQYRGSNDAGRAERRSEPRPAAPSAAPPPPRSNGPAPATGYRGGQRDGGGARDGGARSSAPPASRESGGSGGSGGGPSHARAPHGGGDGGGQSQGTAVRRPR